jgi:hypothetical protein
LEEKHSLDFDEIIPSNDNQRTSKNGLKEYPIKKKISGI